MNMTMVTRPVSSEGRGKTSEEELREKMVRELEVDLSYALRPEGVARRQGWGMKKVSCLAKSDGSGDCRFYPSP